MARTQLGYYYLRTGRPADGIRVCREAVRVRSDYAAAWDTLGLCLRGQGKGRGAIEAFARAVQLAPHNATFAAHLADARRTTAGTRG